MFQNEPARPAVRLGSHNSHKTRKKSALATSDARALGTLFDRQQREPQTIRLGSLFGV